MAPPLLFFFVLLSSVSCMAQMQQQPMGPPGQALQFGQPMGPPGQGVQFGQAMGPPGQPMGPPGQALQFGQPMGPPGQTMSPPGQPISPPEQTTSPPGPPMSPPGPPMSSYGQTMSPPGQPMGPPGQTTSPPGQPMGPPGPPMSPPGPPMSYYGQTMSPYGQTMSPPGQPMGPPGQTTSPPAQPMDQPVTAVRPESIGLSLDFYTRTCPKLEQIVQDMAIDKQQKQTATAAGMLRLFFHDCMVEGCDASVLVNSNHLNKAEKDSDMNDSLSGDAFELVGRIKNALELTCPGTVSCADILALATRNLVKMVGGPYYKVHLGRRDGTVSMAANVEANLARATDPMDKILAKLAGKGFGPEEVVALVGGGHTIGFAHCKEFIDRMKSYTKVSPTDPGVNPGFAERMKQMCANYPADTTMSCFLDPNTPGQFDNVYFKNLYWGMGLLPSDHALVTDSRTEPFVKRFADNDTAFFEVFSKAMEKVSTVGVKTGVNGEIRHRCDVINHFKM